MMHMTFYWGRKVTLLIDAWKTETWTEYLLTLLACLLFSLFYQYMEDRRLRFKLLLSSSTSLNNNSSSSAAAVAVAQPPSSARTPLLIPYAKVGGGRWNSARFAGAVLFGVNSAIGYLLMLAVMSFNGGVFVAIVVGLALGYLFFRSADHEGGVVVLDNPCACA